MVIFIFRHVIVMMVVLIFRHAVVMMVILIFRRIFIMMVFIFRCILGLAVLRHTFFRMSLSRIKAFSDNLVEHMPIGLVATDDQKRITSLNHVAGTTLGLSAQGVVGKNAADVLPEDLWQMIKELDMEKGVVEKEMDCSVGEAGLIPLEIGATPLRDEKGRFFGYVILFKDLSEVRSLRKEIARSQRLASVGRLAAGVSHEIRNPLSSIKGFATYFKERYHDVPENQQISNLMIQEVDRLNRVVGQLHEFARPVKISRKSIPVKDFLTDALKLVERQAAEATIDIETRFDPEIETAFFDPDRINQVLLNLFLNAIESMDNGGTMTVVLEKNVKKGGIEILVSDTGTGIDERDLAHVFDPYFTTKASGTGLGLAIAHNILEAHDGEIKVESRLDQGTNVRIVLPDRVDDRP